jgi:bifunctional DNA-binding transcriptional regulator/antitoxin component of YhaV-PrlF toxin-antitoxin module
VSKIIISSKLHSKIDDKGNAYIPEFIRELLKLNFGDQIKFLLTDNVGMFIKKEDEIQNHVINLEEIKKQNQHYKISETETINYIDMETIKPDHYKIGGIETIDYIRAKQNKEEFTGYLHGNVIKYISRYKYKNGLEDLIKAEYYLSLLIRTIHETEFK